MPEQEHIFEDATEAESGPRTDRTAFLFHLGAYLLVNGVLALINLSGEVPEGQTRELWFVWPLAGWGIGVAAHGLALALKRMAETSPAQPNLFQDRDVRAVAVHLFVYLAVNTLLIAVNLTQTPGSFWFIWPLAGWGVGLAAHAIVVYRAVLRRTAEHYATEQRILQEMQVERLAAAIAATIEPEGETEAPEAEKPLAKKPARKPARRKRAAAKTKKPRARKKPAAAKTKTAKTSAKAKTTPRTRAKSTVKAASKTTAKSASRTSSKSSGTGTRTRKAPAKKRATRRKPAAEKVS